jgi:hypothetical protein
VDQLPLVLEPWLFPIADALDNEDQRRENEAVEREQKKQQKAARK